MTGPSALVDLSAVDLSAVDWCTVHDRLEPLLASEPPAGASSPTWETGDVGFWGWVIENHRQNAQLWSQEDLARRRHVPASDIVANKRAIDAHNQARNDAVERIDTWLLNHWVPHDASPDARLHSETPGSMIDRLSILWLKVRAMRTQARRPDLEDPLRQACSERELVLQEQQSDLAGCLQALLSDVRAGRARFKRYRQFKMYNDPRLNPALVAERGSLAARASARPDVCQPTGESELPMLDVYMPMMKSAAIVAAARLGLFAALSEGPRDAASLATALQSAPAGVQALADFLVSLGYLVRVGGGVGPSSGSGQGAPTDGSPLFSLSAFARRWFTRDGQVDYTAGVLWTHEAWTMMGQLDQAVRDGRPAVSLWQRMQTEPHLGPLFSRYMHAFARHLSPDVVARVPVAPQQTRLLDLGGSHGLHSIGLCRAHAQLHATVADWAASLTDTAAHIQQAGLGQRIDTLAGDILLEQWVQPQGFDLILYLSVGHNQDDAGNARMLQAMARSLRHGGLIVVHDYLIGQPLNAFHAAFHLTLLFETGTRTWAEADYARWARGAGLVVRERIDLDPVEKGSLLLIGWPHEGL